MGVTSGVGNTNQTSHSDQHVVLDSSCPGFASVNENMLSLRRAEVMTDAMLASHDRNYITAQQARASAPSLTCRTWRMYRR